MVNKNRKILIVDDNPTNVLALTEILEDFRVKNSASGEEALKIACEFNPDLILMDIMMPGMTGYDVCRKIRNIPSLFQTKIVLVSAKATLNERLKGYEAGANDYVVKPFEPYELLAKVNVYLRLKTEEEVNKITGDFINLLNLKIESSVSRIIAPTDELIGNADMDPKQQMQFLRDIKHGTVFLKELFEKVAILSKLKSWDIEYQWAKENLNGLIEDIIDSLSVTASERHIVLRSNLVNAAECELDRVLLSRAITTIIRNALRFSPSDTEVLVDLTRSDCGYKLDVSDHGPGINPTILNNVVCETYDAAGDDVQTGYGLNLMIARHIILAHGGQIHFNRNDSQTTLVSVTLPQI